MKDFKKLQEKLDELKALLAEQEPEEVPPEETPPEETPPEELLKGPNYEQFVAIFGQTDDEDKNAKVLHWADKIVETFGDEAEDFFAIFLPTEEAPPEEVPEEEKKPKTEEKKNKK